MPATQGNAMTPAEQSDERRAFEAWARNHHSMRDQYWFKESPDLAGDLPDSWAAWQAATAAERERCAKVCDGFFETYGLPETGAVNAVSAAIRQG